MYPNVRILVMANGLFSRKARVARFVICIDFAVGGTPVKLSVAEVAVAEWNPLL